MLVVRRIRQETGGLARSKIMPANVSGSVGSVAKSSEAIHLATTNDPKVPSAIPNMPEQYVALVPGCDQKRSPC